MCKDRRVSKQEGSLLLMSSSLCCCTRAFDCIAMCQWQTLWLPRGTQKA